MATTIYSTYLVTIYLLNISDGHYLLQGRVLLVGRRGSTTGPSWRRPDKCSPCGTPSDDHPVVLQTCCWPPTFQRIHPNILFVHGGHICSDKIKYSKKHFSNYSPIQKYFLPDASERLAYQLIVCSCHLS